MSNQSNPTQNAQCPVCTSILTKEDRAQAAAKNLHYLTAIEAERNLLMRVLYGILRETSGEITLRRLPATEDVAKANIEYTPRDDGGLKIALPAGIVVEGRDLIIAGR